MGQGSHVGPTVSLVQTPRWPAAHSLDLQLAFPVSSWYSLLDTMHLAQASASLSEPVLFPYRPTGHKMHASLSVSPVAPFGPYEPIGHALHSDAFVSPVATLYRPVGQSVQVGGLVPASSEVEECEASDTPYLPLLHTLGMQLGCPA